MGTNSQKEMKKVGQAAIFGIIFMVAVLFAVLVRIRFIYSERLYQAQQRVAQLEDAITEERERTEQIEQLREYMHSDDYQQMQARSRLGMVKENEILFEEEEE